MENIFISNPHAIMEAYLQRPGALKRCILPDAPQGVWIELEKICRDQKIPYQMGLGKVMEEDKAASYGKKKMFGAFIKAKVAKSLTDLVDKKGKLYFACDNIQDPQNLGSIFRTAAFFGISGIILPVDRTASVTATVYDVSAGGVERVDFCHIVNLRQALEDLKRANIWILGTSEHAKEKIQQVKADRSWCVVFGSEQTGLRPLILKACDMICSIPSASEGFGSLNVANSAAVLSYHLSGDR